MPHEHAVPAVDIDTAGKDFRFVLRAAWMRGVLEGTDATPTDADGLVEIRLSKSGSDIVAHGTLKATLEAPCARCMSPARFALNQSIAALFSLAKALPRGDEGEIELSAEDAEVMPYDGELLVLDDFIRDELVLEIPMIPLCSEDCPGISPLPSEGAKDEAAHPVDPRLSPLMNFRLPLKETKKE